MKRQYLLLLLSTFTYSIRPMEQERDEIQQAFSFIYEKNAYEFYEDKRKSLLNALVKKNITEVKTILDSCDTKARAHCVNAPVKLWRLSDSYDCRYPELCAFLKDFKKPYDISNVTPLGMAIVIGDDALVNLLYSYNARVEHHYEENYTHVQLATKFNPRYIPFLINKGAQINRKGCEDAPIIIAAQIGSVEAAKALCDNGASLEHQSSLLQLTPLCIAVNNGHYDLVKWFIDQGASINKKDANGWTPLHWSIANWKSHITQLLLEHGADIHACSNKGTSAIEFIRFKDSISAKNLICQGAPYPTSDVHQNIVLEGLQTGLEFSNTFYRKFVLSIVQGNTPAALLAIKEASHNDLNTTSMLHHNLSPLHWAIIRNNETVVKALLATYVPLDTFTYKFKKFCASIPLIKYFVQQPVIINSIDDKQRTPLMWAERLNYTGLRDLILKTDRKAND